MGTPAERAERRDYRAPRPPLVSVATFEPSAQRDPQIAAFVIPGIFLDAGSRTIAQYGPRRASDLGVRTHVISTQLRGRNDNPLDQQANAIAERVLKTAADSGMEKVILGGDSQGANIAVKLNRIVTETGLSVAELHLRYPRGFTWESPSGLVGLMARDIVGTGYDLPRHPARNRDAVPVIRDYFRDTTQGLVRAWMDGALPDTVAACGPLNHDTRRVTPGTKVVIEIGENDVLAYERDLFPNRIPGTRPDKLAADLWARFFPQLDPADVTVVVTPGARHIGILHQTTNGFNRRSV